MQRPTTGRRTTLILSTAIAAPLTLAAGIAASHALAPAVAQADEAATADRAAIKKARAEADDLLRKVGLAKDEKKRLELAARFDALDPRARVPCLLEGLKPARTPGVQVFAVSRLKALGIREIVPHLVLLASAPGAEKTPRDEAHAGAVSLDADLARRWYEHVVANDLGKQRILALGRVAEIASPDSVPLLARVVATVGLEVHLQVAQLTDMASVPVNLGSAGAAATQVAIQLPTISLIDVHVNAQVPAAIQVAVRSEALRGLRTIAGDLGEDPEKYMAWHRERRK